MAKQRPDIGALVAAYLTGELRLQVGQAHVITPAAGVDQSQIEPARAFLREPQGQPELREDVPGEVAASPRTDSSDDLWRVHGKVKAVSIADIVAAAQAILPLPAEARHALD